MTISRMQQPRQLYGLGSLVKSVKKGIKGAVKGVKDFAKSNVGKLALTYAVTGGLGNLAQGNKFFTNFTNPMEFIGGAKNIFSGEGISNIVGNIPFADKFAVADKSKGPTFGQTLGMFGLGTAAFTALAAAGLDPDNPNEMPRDVESLRGYLKSGYMKLNPDSSPREAEQFAIQNTSEYATGGRVGLAKGTEMASADNPFFRSDYADEHSYRMFGKPYKDLTSDELEEFREEMERLRNKFMADGGRVNYAEGTKEGLETLIIPKKPKFQTEEEVNATTLGRAEIGDPMPGRLESAKKLKGIMELYDRLKNMAESGEMSNEEEAMTLFNQRLREEAKNLHFLDKEKLEDYIRENRAYGGRMQYAMGSPEENAVQAAGIMNLPLHKNKAGVTELDLRETGGFIPPVGVKEKADDIPAMLSNNEFVFTAKSVREMGDGDVNKGAQRMYNMMKTLENGGRIA